MINRRILPPIPPKFKDFIKHIPATHHTLKSRTKYKKITAESNTFTGFVPYETTITADTYVYGTLYEDWATTAITNKIPPLVGFYLQKYAKNSIFPLPPWMGDMVIPHDLNPHFSNASTTC